MGYKRKKETDEDVVWNGVVYRRNPSHRALHRRRYFMATVHPRKYLHVAIYESVHGEVPTGYHVHHLDEDYNNNAPDNLVALPPTDHSRLHWKNRVGIIKTCLKCGKKYTAFFARSKWCSAACKEQKRRDDGVAYKRPRKPAENKELACLACGVVFFSTKPWAKFCSSRCKQRFNKKKQGEK